MRRTLRWVTGALALSLAALTGALVLQTRSPEPQPPRAVESASPPTATAVVEVDAARTIRRLNNPADFQNQADHSQNLSPWQEGRMRSLRPRVTRAWVAPQRYFDPGTGVFTFDYRAPNGGSLYRYLDQVVSYSDSLFLNFNQCDQSIMESSAISTCAEALYQGIKHYKQRYPKFEFVEIFNEPDRDWEEPAGTPRKMSPQTYYLWYQAAYRAVNRVNTELDPRVRVRVGGPVTYHFNAAYLTAFLDAFKADPDPAKRLDFLSYHQYKARENPASVAKEKETIRRWLADRGLNRELPVYVTEYGVFPGDRTGTTYDEDLRTQAAAMAVLSSHYATSGMDMPMHWVIDHPTNTRKSLFVDGVDHAVYPAFNVVQMQRKLKNSVVRSTSTDLSAAGIGVTPLATADDTGMAIMVTNYQWINVAGPRHTVAVKTNSTLGAALVTVYVVDSSHGNYAADPARSDLEVLSTRHMILTGDTTVAYLDLEPNAIALVTIEPSE